jgi:hypothetical protein
MEERIKKIALDLGYDLALDELLTVMHKFQIPDPSDDDIALWVLITLNQNIDWASVLDEAIITDPVLRHTIIQNN